MTLIAQRLKSSCGIGPENHVTSEHDTCLVMETAKGPGSVAGSELAVQWMEYLIKDPRFRVGEATTGLNPGAFICQYEVPRPCFDDITWQKVSEGVVIT